VPLTTYLIEVLPVPYLAQQSAQLDETGITLSLFQVALIEAKPEEGAGRARVLGKGDAAVGQKQPGLDLSHSTVPSFWDGHSGEHIAEVLVGQP
jgi:hypothetical protein